MIPFQTSQTSHQQFWKLLTINILNNKHNMHRPQSAHQTTGSILRSTPSSSQRPQTAAGQERDESPCILAPPYLLGATSKYDIIAKSYESLIKSQFEEIDDNGRSLGTPPLRPIDIPAFIPEENRHVHWMKQTSRLAPAINIEGRQHLFIGVRMSTLTSTIQGIVQPVYIYSQDPDAVETEPNFDDGNIQETNRSSATRRWLRRRLSGVSRVLSRSRSNTGQNRLARRSSEDDQTSLLETDS